MKFHKSVMDRLIFANVDYLEKGWTPPKGAHSISFQFPHSNTTTTNFIDDKKKATWKDYKYDKDKGEMRVREHWPKEEKGKKQRQYKTTKIPASASHEEELKNASLHTRLDELLQKAKGDKITGTAIYDRQKDKVEHNKDLEEPGVPIKQGVDKEGKHFTEYGPYHRQGGGAAQWSGAGGAKRRTTLKDTEAGAAGVEEKFIPGRTSGSGPSKQRKVGQTVSSRKVYRGVPVQDDYGIVDESGKKLKSLHATLDELLQKARPRASERKDPNRRKAEAADDNLIIPDTKHVQTMSNPGPTEAEHYERTRSGSIENLKRLAESKHPMDRKAAAAGMKKHE